MTITIESDTDHPCEAWLIIADEYVKITYRQKIALMTKLGTCDKTETVVTDHIYRYIWL